MRPSLITSLLCALALAVAGCSTAEAAPTTTEPPPTTTSTTTTTVPPTTTTEPPPAVELQFDVPSDMKEPLETFFWWLVDKSNPQPAAPNAMLQHVADVTREGAGAVGAVSAADLASGERVAVARVDRDVVMLIDDGAGWRIAGAALDGATPWLGASQRLVLVLGSDARVGEDQTKLRADSVHLLSVVPDVAEGAIVGFPRDSWVQSPAGRGKLTNVMANRGPEVMLETITNMTQLEIEGYFVTGFEGFIALIDELGGLTIDLPTKMRSGNNWADYPAGPQDLTPQLALRLARIRKGLPAGDFDRSFNQGLIMQAAMDMIQVGGIDLLPEWVRILTENTWTDLSAEEVLTLGASVYFLPSQALVNTVLPGSLGTAGAASVVYLGDGAEAVYRDLEDGLLTVEE